MPTRLPPTTRRAPLALAAAGLVASLLAGTSVGCQSVPKGTRADVNDLSNPIEPDPAMVRRDWPPTESVYQSGRTVAGPTGFGYESSPTQDAGSYNAKGLIVDPAIFLLNVVTAPFTIAAQGFGPQVSNGVEVPPTYTAAPAVPLQPERYTYDGGVGAAAAGGAGGAGGGSGGGASGGGASGGGSGPGTTGGTGSGASDASGAGASGGGASGSGAAGTGTTDAPTDGSTPTSGTGGQGGTSGVGANATGATGTGENGSPTDAGSNAAGSATGATNTTGTSGTSGTNNASGQTGAASVIDSAAPTGTTGSSSGSARLSPLQ